MSMGRRQQVGLFVTCLVDLFRPTVGFAAVEAARASGLHGRGAGGADLLRPAGLQFRRQRRRALAIARQVVAAFEGFDYVVAPSGSCARHDQDALSRAASPTIPRMPRARATLAGKTYELTQFLRDVRGMGRRHGGVREARSPITIPARACASSGQAPAARAAGDRSAACRSRNCRTASCAAASAAPSASSIPDISDKMVERQGRRHRGDRRRRGARRRLGCLLNIAGKLKRAGSTVEARHVAEVLAGMTDDAGDRRGAAGRWRSTAHLFKDNVTRALDDAQLQQALGHVRTGFIDKRAAGDGRAAGVRGAARRRRAISRTTC